MQMWTIVSASDPAVVLDPLFITNSADQHPLDAGFAWQPGGMVALPIAERPDLSAQEWSGSGWVDVLTVLRARRWALVKARRDQAEWAGCAEPLGRVDTDPESQRKVGGAVQLALIAAGAGQPFALYWTMQDNSTVEHDGAAMIAMGVAVGQHVAACHEVALAKRAAIEAAADRAAIEAVDLEEGWPA